MAQTGWRRRFSRESWWGRCLGRLARCRGFRRSRRRLAAKSFGKLLRLLASSLGRSFALRFLLLSAHTSLLRCRMHLGGLRLSRYRLNRHWHSGCRGWGRSRRMSRGRRDSRRSCMGRLRPGKGSPLRQRRQATSTLRRHRVLLLVVRSFTFRAGAPRRSTRGRTSVGVRLVSTLGSHVRGKHAAGLSTSGISEVRR